MPTFRQELGEFAKLSRKYSSKVPGMKAEGKKVVCYYGSKVPVEIIHASGAAPYPLFDGGDSGPTEVALSYLLSFANVQSLYQIGQHEMGLNPVTPIADLIVIDCKESDSVRVGDVFEFKGLPVWKLGVPQDWEKKISFTYYIQQLGHLKEALEKLTGHEITDEKLLASIEKYNRIRGLLDEIRLLRKKHPPLIGGLDFIRLNHYAVKCDPEVAIKCLEKIRDSLRKDEGGDTPEALRLMIAGRGFAFGDYILLKTIEESGGVVVTELLDEGMVYPGEAKIKGEPLQNLAEFYYRAMVPCCLFNPSWGKRSEQLDVLSEEYGVQGLLYYLLRFDVIYDYEYPIFSQWADKRGLPFGMIESSYDFSREATETLKTRIESFIKICAR